MSVLSLRRLLADRSSSPEIFFISSFVWLQFSASGHGFSSAGQEVTPETRREVSAVICPMADFTSNLVEVLNDTMPGGGGGGGGGVLSFSSVFPTGAFLPNCSGHGSCGIVGLHNPSAGVVIKNYFHWPRGLVA